MKAIIKLDVPEWQIGQDADVYFPDTMLKHGKCELLKEQKPVEPVNVRWEMGIYGGNCPKCINWVQRSYNYCPFCGKEVKWE